MWPLQSLEEMGTALFWWAPTTDAASWLAPPLSITIAVIS